MANNIRVVIQKPVDGSGSGVQSVNGDGVNNTDPSNPVLAFPNADEVDDSTTTNKFATGTNTGDETTGTIQTKRPLKTVNGDSLEGSGDLDIDKKTIESFNTSNTTSFTVPDNSDRVWFNVSFADDLQTITVNASSYSTDGEPIYFRPKTAGLITVQGGVGITGIEFNVSGSATSTGEGDLMGFVRRGSILEQI